MTASVQFREADIELTTAMKMYDIEAVLRYRTVVYECYALSRSKRISVLFIYIFIFSVCYVLIDIFTLLKNNNTN